MSADVDLRIIFNNFLWKNLKKKELLIFFFTIFYIPYKSSIKTVTGKKWNR